MKKQSKTEYHIDHIEIEQTKEFTKIANYSLFKIIISSNPITSKRRKKDLLIINPIEFIITEKPLDFTKIIISFEK